MLDDFRLNVDADESFFEPLNNFSFNYLTILLLTILTLIEIFILCRFYSYFHL